MVEAEIAVASRERWEQRLQAASEAQQGADEITKTTPYPGIRKELEVALERRRVLGVVAPRALPRLHHRVEEVLLEEAHRFR